MSEDLFKKENKLKEWWLYLSDIRDRTIQEDETFLYTWKLIEAEELRDSQIKDKKCANSLIQIFNIPAIYSENKLSLFDEETHNKVLTYLINKNMEILNTIDEDQSSLSEYTEYFNENIDSFNNLFSNRKDMQWSFFQFKDMMNILLEKDVILSHNENSIEDRLKDMKSCINDFISSLSREDLLLYTLDEDCTLLACISYARQYLYAKYYPSSDKNINNKTADQIHYVNYMINNNTVIGKC